MLAVDKAALADVPITMEAVDVPPTPVPESEPGVEPEPEPAVEPAPIPEPQSVPTVEPAPAADPALVLVIVTGSVVNLREGPLTPSSVRCAPGTN